MKIIRKAIRGYYGMNHEASYALHLHEHPQKNTIYIDPHLNGKMLKRTIQHEKIEHYLMCEKGMSYKKADTIAKKFERR